MLAALTCPSNFEAFRKLRLEEHVNAANIQLAAHLRL